MCVCVCVCVCVVIFVNVRASVHAWLYVHCDYVPGFTKRCYVSRREVLMIIWYC